MHDVIVQESDGLGCPFMVARVDLVRKFDIPISITWPLIIIIPHIRRHLPQHSHMFGVYTRVVFGNPRHELSGIASQFAIQNLRFCDVTLILCRKFCDATFACKSAIIGYPCAWAQHLGSTQALKDYIIPRIILEEEECTERNLNASGH